MTCPRCATVSSRVHRCYRRRPIDTAIGGTRVVVDLRGSPVPLCRDRPCGGDVRRAGLGGRPIRTPPNGRRRVRKANPAHPSSRARPAGCGRHPVGDRAPAGQQTAHRGPLRQAAWFKDLFRGQWLNRPTGLGRLTYRPVARGLHTHAWASAVRPGSVVISATPTSLRVTRRSAVGPAVDPGSCSGGPGVDQVGVAELRFRVGLGGRSRRISPTAGLAGDDSVLPMRVQ